MPGSRFSFGRVFASHPFLLRYRSKVFMVVFAVLLLGGASGASDDEWVEVRSENFVVTSNAGAKDARRLVEELETVRVVFRVALSGTPEGGPPLDVLAAKNEKTLEELIPQYAEQKERFFPTGVFFRTPDKNWIALNLDARGDNRFATVYHEYFHSLALPAAPHAPLWFQEGLASMWENTRINKNDVDAARPSRIHLEILQNVSLMRLRDLLVVDHNSREYRLEHRATIFYAQSWALAHYIFLGEPDNSLSKGIRPYLDSLEHGVEPIAAFEQAFGELETIEASLRNYVRRRKFNILRVAKPKELDESRLETVVLKPSQYHAKLGSYFTHIRLHDEALTHIDLAIQDNKNDSLAHESRGIIQFRRDDNLEAAGSLAKAITLNGSRYLPHFYLGALAAASNTDDGIVESRRHFERSVRANPFHAPSLARLAILYGLAGEQLELALGMARRAAALMPDDPIAVMALGVTLRAHGNLGEAVDAFERALRIDPSLEFASTQLSEIRATTPEL